MYSPNTYTIFYSMNDTDDYNSTAGPHIFHDRINLLSTLYTVLDNRHDASLKLAHTLQVPQGDDGSGGGAVVRDRAGVQGAAEGAAPAHVRLGVGRRLGQGQQVRASRSRREENVAAVLGGNVKITEYNIGNTTDFFNTVMIC